MGECAAHRSDCPFFEGGECWFEAGSALYGEVITGRLLAEGSAGVWDEIDRALSEAANQTN